VGVSRYSSGTQPRASRCQLRRNIHRGTGLAERCIPGLLCSPPVEVFVQQLGCFVPRAGQKVSVAVQGDCNGTGEAALVNEIERARRSGVALVFAYLEVEGPRDGNDREGDTASDAALRKVVTVMQSKLRPYDPVVRWGRGAFLCTITDADLDDAGGRLEEIRNALADSHPGAKVEFGIAALRKDDTLETLIDRADAALQETKRVP